MTGEVDPELKKQFALNLLRWRDNRRQKLLISEFDRLRKPSDRRPIHPPFISIVSRMCKYASNGRVTMASSSRKIWKASALAIAPLLLSLAISGPAQAAPACKDLPAPFPCGQGTHPVCSNRVKCYGGTGTVPQLISVCTQTKCVKNPPSVPPQKPGAVPKIKRTDQLNPQPEPPGRTK